MQFGISNARFFFDRQRVAGALSSYQFRVLSRTGAAGQTIVKRNIKEQAKRKGTAAKRRAKGQVTSHTGRLRQILFSYDPIRGSVVIGPRLFRNQATTIRAEGGIRISYRPIGRTIPQLLNEGGRSRRLVEYPSGQSQSLTVLYQAFRYVDNKQPAVMKAMRRIAREERVK